MFASCETEFNLDRHLLPFMMENAFFASISRQLNKVPTRALPTAAVAYDTAADQLTLYWNPDFLSTLEPSEIRGLLTHEFYHIVFGHLSSRRKPPPSLWNIATDLAINSLIVENSSRSVRSSVDSDGRALPKGALIPGKWPTSDEREPSKEEKQAMTLASVIASLPKLESSEFYFMKIQEAASKNRTGAGSEGGGEDGEMELGPLDSHEPWDDVSDVTREIVAGKVKSMVERAVREADRASAGGWGNIPADIRESIRRSVSTIINWKSVLRQFIGSIIRGARTTSIKRINRRYPYIHPGIKRGWTAKLLVAVDQSGSVGDEMLSQFFAELVSLTKKVEIDLLPFDCACSDNDVVKWTKGTIPFEATQRVKCGGTNFDAPTNVFNDPKNRGRWDGLLILTDGCAPAPGPTRLKRGWILGNGCKLEFPSDELQIFVTKEQRQEGAWR